MESSLSLGESATMPSKPGASAPNSIRGLPLGLGAGIGFGVAAAIFAFGQARPLILLACCLSTAVLAFLFFRSERRRTRQLAQSFAGMERARFQAEAANAAKTRFLATMSHEIRTPMSGVNGMNSSLLHSAITPEARSN